jgi:CheY-like chemotaxis protein
VADTGPGVPEDKRSIIFEPFEQADNSITRAYGGTGLGLVISKRLVEAMNGRIWVEGRHGSGSMFHFTVELGRVDNAPETAPARELAEDPADGSCSGLRVLLAEDNSINRTVALRLLGKLGCHVTVAGTGLEVLALIQSTTFDLILMDVQMPEMDGLAATAEIRRQELSSGGHLPIAAMTAGAMHGDAGRCLAAGMDDYVAKPLDLRELRDTIARLCPAAGAADRALR